MVNKLYASYNLYRMAVDEEMQFITYLKLLNYSEQEAKDIIAYLCLSNGLPGFEKLLMVR